MAWAIESSGRCMTSYFFFSLSPMVFSFDELDEMLLHAAAFHCAGRFFDFWIQALDWTIRRQNWFRLGFIFGASGLEFSRLSLQFSKIFEILSALGITWSLTFLRSFEAVYIWRRLQSKLRFRQEIIRYVLHRSLANTSSLNPSLILDPLK